MKQIIFQEVTAKELENSEYYLLEYPSGELLYSLVVDLGERAKRFYACDEENLRIPITQFQHIYKRIDNE